MKLSKRICTEECEVSVMVEDVPFPTETLIGFENRLIEIANKLVLAPVQFVKKAEGQNEE